MGPRAAGPCRSVFQRHASRPRVLLAATDAEMFGIELVSQGTSYVLRMPETLSDAYRFEELVTPARGQRAPADAAAMYREALSRWQGPAPTGGIAVDDAVAKTGYRTPELRDGDDEF